jgi:CheY-like chemotaxis protein
LLPQPQSAIPHPISHPSPKPKSGPRVLFIDDEPSLASAASRLLARAGFEVTCTTDPLDALERFLANPDGFDVVVTDFAMPHCNGLELARRLRAVRPDIPLILCTGDATHLSRDQVLKVGIVEMLNKPVDAFTLEAVVREVARKSAPRPATG